RAREIRFWGWPPVESGCKRIMQRCARCMIAARAIQINIASSLDTSRYQIKLTRTAHDPWNSVCSSNPNPKESPMAEANPSIPYFCEGSEAMLQLEAMVDAVGLRNVLYALEHICHEKAEHLKANWQDSRTAKAWTKEALRLQRAADRVDGGSR